jgi:hypothetical protein
MLHTTLLHTVYLQISPHSQTQGTPAKTWVEKLATRSIEEIRQSVAARYPYAIISKIEGIDKDEHGNDSSFPIDDDHELDVYLSHVHGRKALLVLTLGQM